MDRQEELEEKLMEKYSASLLHSESLEVNASKLARHISEDKIAQEKEAAKIMAAAVTGRRQSSSFGRVRSKTAEEVREKEMSDATAAAAEMAEEAASPRANDSIVEEDME